MNKKLFMISFIMLFTVSSFAQKLAVNTNLLGWAAYGTINVGLEPALSPKWTLALDGYYNPYKYESGSQTEAWGVQPEVRFWLKSKFAGGYFGLHGMYSDYDCGMKMYRYNGTTTGAGLSYGNAIVLAKRLRLNLNLGLGWLRNDYEKTGLPQWEDRDIIYYGHTLENRFGITKASVAITFIIR